MEFPQNPTTGISDSDTGFISRVSPVQVRPLLLPSICHTPAKDYHLWKEVSCSQLKCLADSPAEFYGRHEARDTPPKSSPSMDWGTLVHTWVEIGHDEYEQREAIAPVSVTTATGQLGKAAEGWLKDLPPDAIPISLADSIKLRAQTKQLMENPASRELLEGAIDKEFNVRFQMGGHDCRCRVDGATLDCFWDIKTVRDSDPDKSFGWAARDWKYDLQAAYYGVAAQQLGWPKHSLKFIATSNVYPYHCAVLELPRSVLDAAEARCLELLDELQARRAANYWLPDFYGQVLEVPAHIFQGRTRW